MIYQNARNDIQSYNPYKYIKINEKTSFLQHKFYYYHHYHCCIIIIIIMCVSYLSGNNNQLIFLALFLPCHKCGIFIYFPSRLLVRKHVSFASVMASLDRATLKLVRDTLPSSERSATCYTRNMTMLFELKWRRKMRWIFFML